MATPPLGHSEFQWASVHFLPSAASNPFSRESHREVGRKSTSPRHVTASRHPWGENLMALAAKRRCHTLGSCFRASPWPLCPACPLLVFLSPGTHPCCFPAAEPSGGRPLRGPCSPNSSMTGCLKSFQLRGHICPMQPLSWHLPFFVTIHFGIFMFAVYFLR